MGRALFAVGTLLVLLIGGFSLLVFLTRDEESVAVDNLLSEDITRAIALADREVDLRRLAQFPWDEVVIVARDTPAAAISERLGDSWRGDLRFRTGELLIFLEGGDVARFADYRGDMRFEGFDEPFHTLPRERAVLQISGSVVEPAP